MQYNSGNREVKQGLQHKQQEERARRAGGWKPRDENHRQEHQNSQRAIDLREARRKDGQQTSDRQLVREYRQTSNEPVVDFEGIQRRAKHWRSQKDTHKNGSLVAVPLLQRKRPQQIELFFNTERPQVPEDPRARDV